MSAKEQLLWYLERLCAQTEEMSSVLGVARVGDPPMATSLVDPAASTTHASSAPVPDISCSITKSQEVLEVIHDAAPASIAMAPVTCSTDGSTQVVAIANVDEVHDTTTTVHREPTVDPIHQAVEQLTPGQATASSAGVISPVTTTTDVDPKAGVQELDALSVNTSTQVMSKANHGVVLIIPSDFSAPMLTMCSTNYIIHGDDPVQPTARTDHRPHGVHLVGECTGLLLPPLQKGTEPQQWPPPVQVQFAEDDIVLFRGIICGFFTNDSGCVWWPPDHQPRRIHTELQTPIVTSVQLQPWPSGNFQPTHPSSNSQSILGSLVSGFPLSSDGREENSSLHLFYLIAQKNSNGKSHGHSVLRTQLLVGHVLYIIFSFPYQPTSLEQCKYGLNHLPGTMQIMGMSVHCQFWCQEDFTGSGRVEFQINSALFATTGSTKKMSELKPLNRVAWSNSVVLSDAICGCGVLPSGHQSFMLQKELTQGMQQQAGQLHVPIYRRNDPLWVSWDPGILTMANLAICSITSANRIWSWTLSLLYSVNTLAIQQYVTCNRVCIQLHQFGLLSMHLIDGIPLCSHQSTATGDFMYKSWQRQYNFSGCFRGILTNQFLHLWSLKHDSDDSDFTKHGKLTITSKQHHSCLATGCVHMSVLVLQDLNAAQSTLKIAQMLKIEVTTVGLQPRTFRVRQSLLGIYMSNISSHPGTVLATHFGTASRLWKQPTLIIGMRSGCEQVSMEEHFNYLQYVQLQLWRLPTHTHGSALGEQQSGFKFWPVKLLFRDNYACEAWYCCIFDNWIMSKLMGITSQDDTMYGVNFTFSFLHAHSGEQIQSLTQDFSCMCFLNNTYIQLVGSRAKVQFTSLITFKGCSPLGATTFGDNTYDMPSFTSKRIITEDIYARTTYWTLIQFVVTVLHDGDSSMVFPLHSLRNWCLARGFLLDIILRVWRCPSHVVSKLDGMVDKAEPIFKMGIPIHLSEQQLTSPVPDEDLYAYEDIQAAIYVHKSWDPGGVTMPVCNPQSGKILRVMLTSHEAQAMSGMLSSQCSDEEHFQGGGNVIVVALAAGLLEGYVDNMYYISFCKDYFLDTSFGQVAIGHGYYNLVIQVNPNFNYNHDYELVKEHQVQWDPDGSRWRRLGGKSNFKEGGC